MTISDKKKKKKRNKLYRRVVAVTILLIIFLLILKKTGVIGDSNSIEVEVEKVQLRTIIETITASGKLRPEREVTISSDVSGEIIELYFKEGDKVKKGDLLLRIKPDEYQSMKEDAEATYNSSIANLENSKAQLLQSEASFKLSKASYNRYLILKEKNAVSAADFDRIESEYITSKAQVEATRQRVIGAKYSMKSSEARLKKAKENLKKTTIYSPMDGIITVQNNEVGERVVGTAQMQGTAIMKIADLNIMEVWVDVNENDIIRISKGDTAEIEVDAFPDEKFKGLVTEIANSSKEDRTAVDQITTFEIKIKILEKSYEHLIDTTKIITTPFRPGMSSMVDIRTKQVDNVLSVPILSVTTRKNKDIKNDTSIAKEEMKEVVFVYKESKVQIKKVKIGIQDDYFIQIIEGVDSNDLVVSGPFSIVSKILKDEQKVKKASKSDE